MIFEWRKPARPRPWPKTSRCASVQILGGRLAGAAPEVFAAMAADYGVSLNIVREALTRLAADKLIQRSRSRVSPSLP